MLNVRLRLVGMFYFVGVIKYSTINNQCQGIDKQEGQVCIARNLKLSTFNLKLKRKGTEEFLLPSLAY